MPISRLNFAGAGPLRSSNLTTIKPTRIAPASALDLPGEQKFALVYLRKARGDALAEKIIPHLRETGVPFPDKPDWRVLGDP